MENNEFFESVDAVDGSAAVAVEAAPKKKKPSGKYGNPLGVKIFILCLLIVPMVTFAIFVVYGNLGGLVQAFFSLKRGDDGVTRVTYVGFENFKTFFREINDGSHGGISVKQMIINSFAYLFLVMFISVPISIIVSFFIYKKVPGNKLAIVLLYMPNILPASILAVYWEALMDINQSGVLAKALNWLMGYPINNNRWITTQSNLRLYIYTVYFGFGYNAILIWGAMSRIPEELVEAANLDGASLLKEFWNITIPVIWPTLSMVFVLTWMVPFSVVNQPLMLDQTGKHGTMTWGLYMMVTITGGATGPYYASALSILAACVSLPTTLLVRKALDKVYPVIEV